MATVRCTDCGLLAVRHATERTYCEVEDGLRKTGEWPMASNPIRSI